MGLRVGVLEDRPAPRVDEEHLARAQPPAADRVGRGQGDRPGLRRDRDEPVRRHRERRRPEPVAVEDRPDPAAVGEDDRGRAVPRGEQPGGPPPERGRVRVRRAAEGRRLGHRGQQRRAQVPAGRDEQLDHLVERLRVGAFRREERPGLDEVAGHGRRPPRDGVAGPAPDLLAVAADGVDLAVVGDRAERLGEAPGRLGVRRVALVEQRVAERDRRGEVRVEGREAAAGDEALVDDGPARHRRDRRGRRGPRPGPRDLEPTPGEDEAPVELGVGIGRPVRASIGRPTIAWATSGRVAAAAEPSAPASTGTRRHAATARPFGRERLANERRGPASRDAGRQAGTASRPQARRRPRHPPAAPGAAPRAAA